MMARNGLHARWRVHPPGGAADSVEEAIATTPEEIERLVTALAQPDADDAYVTHLARPTVVMPFASDDEVPDHVVHLAVRDGWGYFAYAGDAAGWPDGFTGHPQGDPHSPGTYGSYSEYPAGSGLPVPEFTRLLTDFLANAELPTWIRWISEDEPSDL
jgi:hypothetical protein